jgi:hypothetical protein
MHHGDLKEDSAPLWRGINGRIDFQKKESHFKLNYQIAAEHIAHLNVPVEERTNQ